MCLICVEFNRTKDRFDALDMVAAAGREPNSIPPEHLTKVRNELLKMPSDISDQLDIDN